MLERVGRRWSCINSLKFWNASLEVLVPGLSVRLWVWGHFQCSRGLGDQQALPFTEVEAGSQRRQAVHVSAHRK